MVSGAMFILDIVYDSTDKLRNDAHEDVTSSFKTSFFLFLLYIFLSVTQYNSLVTLIHGN